MNLKLVDQDGNKETVDVSVVPRVGEHIKRAFKIGKTSSLTDHYYLVKDVIHDIDFPADDQVFVLIQEVQGFKPWF